MDKIDISKPPDSISIKIEDKDYVFYRKNDLIGKFGVYYIDDSDTYFMKITNKLRMITYEVKCLKLLIKYDFVPKYIKSGSNYIITSYIKGSEVLSKKNEPANLQIQLSNILDIFDRYDLNHNDLLLQNILVKDESIYIIDFGLSSFGDIPLRVLETGKNDRYRIAQILKDFKSEKS